MKGMKFYWMTSWTFPIQNAAWKINIPTTQAAVLHFYARLIWTALHWLARNTT